MWRWEVLKIIIDTRGYQSYLEIGVDQRHTFDQIPLENKVGVDPGRGPVRMTSDQYFKTHKDTSFDLIFIDGLHEKNQAIRDVENSLRVLNEGGLILCHDCNPREEYRLEKRWSGNVWEAIAHFRSTRSDLSIYTIDEDTGMTAIWPGEQGLWVGPVKPTFEYLEKHRENLLRVVSFDDFMKIWSGC